MPNNACFFFSSGRRNTSYWRDWSSVVCSSYIIGLLFYRTDLLTISILSQKVGAIKQKPDVGVIRHGHQLKIGRASCREQVLMYVIQVGLCKADAALTEALVALHVAKYHDENYI